VIMQPGLPSQADLAFTALASDYLDDRAERYPQLATDLGDHRHDARLPDFSAAASAAERRALDGFAARLAAIDTDALPAEHQVDARMLANSVAQRIFELDELRERSWNPQLANPGRAIHMLLLRDFAPLPERLASVAGRLGEVPAVLADARGRLGRMPKVHVETAVGQFSGTISLVTSEIDAALKAEPGCAGQIESVRPAALRALAEHQAWLLAKLEQPSEEFADPRIGPERFARKLSLTLDAEADADAILARAQADLDRVSEEIAGLAAELGGGQGVSSQAVSSQAVSSQAVSGQAVSSQALVRQVLSRLADDAAGDATILDFCRRALAGQTRFVNECQLVSTHDDPVEVIEMPEISRGVAVAYCDSPGPLETAPLPTFVAVSPTPADWPARRVASFYREYNRHMVHNLMVHEAMPGHFLQGQHSRRFTGSATALRAALRSGSFVEGWAVYAEQLMADHGYPGEGDPRQVRMQQLKMQLRMIINAILDARVHGHGMTEDEAMGLMTGRGYQEEGEAAGKWRRALLTSAQLSTYYVGYTEVAGLAAELKAVRPQQSGRELHDSMLAHGSPPVRHLRALVLG
jgi:hypothetical protein